MTGTLKKLSLFAPLVEKPAPKQRLWYSNSPQILEKESKSLIHPFVFNKYRGLSINPYKGCHHRCAYCYATYEWSPEFYDTVYAKSNAAQVLDEQLAGWKSDQIGPVMVGSATDAYQPAEVRYGLTRECLRVLQRHNVPYYVFTKSTSILRDLELHAGYSDNCAIIWSITTCEERLRRVLEPGTPPASKMFKVISEFSRRGVACGINVDPIMPLITDSAANFEQIIRGAKDAGARHVFGSILRMRPDIWDRMKSALAMLGVSDFEPRYMQIYGITPELDSSKYWVAGDTYQRRVIDQFYRIVRAAGLSSEFPKHMGPRQLRRPKMGQTALADFAC